MSKRKTPTLQDRLTPCECCAWPITQRHHLLEVAQYGENKHTIQLCANCHELYHVIVKAGHEEYVLERDPVKCRSIPLLQMIEHHLKKQAKDHILHYLHRLTIYAYEIRPTTPPTPS